MRERRTRGNGCRRQSRCNPDPSAQRPASRGCAQGRPRVELGLGRRQFASLFPDLCRCRFAEGAEAGPELGEAQGRQRWQGAGSRLSRGVEALAASAQQRLELREVQRRRRGQPREVQGRQCGHRRQPREVQRRHGGQRCCCEVREVQGWHGRQGRRELQTVAGGHGWCRHGTNQRQHQHRLRAACHAACQGWEWGDGLAGRLSQQKLQP
mmetsp:Transcript_114324/g.369398  ORF Transcript_114324/g.369398 Transcript_114324/m.369398 type:complete len:210 (-) Transcript_114324:7-636(-)